MGCEKSKPAKKKGEEVGDQEQYPGSQTIQNSLTRELFGGKNEYCHLLLHGSFEQGVRTNHWRGLFYEGLHFRVGRATHNKYMGYCGLGKVSVDGIPVNVPLSLVTTAMPM